MKCAQENVNNFCGSISSEEWGEEEFCAVFTNAGMRIARPGPFCLFPDTVTASLLSPYSPTLCPLVVPSVELSSSFGEPSAFLAFVITRAEVEVYFRRKSLYNLYFHYAYLLRSFHTPIISDLRHQPQPWKHMVTL